MVDTQSNEGVFSSSALIEDLQTLATAIESIHADPYRGYGGRIPFHRQLEHLVEEMPETATPAEFHKHVSPLITGLQDGHTTLSLPDDDTASDRQLPISLRVIGNGIFVDGVYDGADTELLGGRLQAVNHLSVEQLLARRNLRPAENRYGQRYRLGSRIQDYERLDRLLDEPEPPAPVQITVELENQVVQHDLQPISDDAEPVETLATTVDTPSGSGPRYQLYEDGAGALFVPGDLQGFRESFEALRSRDAGVVEELAPEAYERHVDADPPMDLSDVIAALPSMIETLVELVTEMKAAGTETLLVDLRDNPGGDSTFVYHIAYVLYGWAGVARAAESMTAVKRRTANHRDYYGPPADGEPSTADRNPADYDFGAALDQRDQSATIDQLRETLEQSETFSEVADRDTYAGYYEPPQVVVLTTAKTFSSGFAGVAQLSTLGADIVGVPSGQAPVSYGEAVEKSLPNTGLTASIAGSAYEWVPNPDGNVLVADRELTPDAFVRFQRSGDAGLRLAFEHADLTDGEPPEPVSWEDPIESAS